MNTKTKTCSKCRETKPLSEFARRLLGYHSHCKECGREYIRGHYQKNKQYYLEKNRRKQTKLVEIVREAKSAACADCGRKFPYYVMDFDHIDGEDKVAEVATLVRSRSIRRVQEEIAKCDVVCANCHRIRTQNRKIKRT